MPVEPNLKRAVTFVDGQNLYHAAKAAFGYTYPNYDVQKLSAEICRLRRGVRSLERNNSPGEVSLPGF